MAKGNLFLSQARGKVGSVVFYRKDGEQVTRVYTSQVSNPKTSAQNAQRAIFYTAQRWAAGAKYLIEQGQEGITNPTKARQAFLKQALNDIRSAYLTNTNMSLNSKGYPYMQPVPISLTKGNLQKVNYRYDSVREGGTKYPFFLPLTVNYQNYTLQQLFNDCPAMGLGKQVTVVFLVSTSTLRDSGGTIIADGPNGNHSTSLQYAEIVFTSDPAALTKNAFVAAEDTAETGDVEVLFNPEVLAPSWGGTQSFFGIGESNMIQLPNVSATPLAFAVIVSDYTNNKWSRSDAPFAINPDFTYDNRSVIASYGNDAAEVTGEEYLDQADVVDEGQQAGLAPRSIKVNLVDADPISMSRSLAKSVSLSVDSASRIGIQITPMNGDYSADSASVSVSGTADDYTISSPFLLPTAYGKAWVVDLQPTTDPEAGQTTVVAISVAGSTRTLTINWTASV